MKKIFKKLYSNVTIYLSDYFFETYAEGIPSEESLPARRRRGGIYKKPSGEKVPEGCALCIY
jgi:hypothetical protein